MTDAPAKKRILFVDDEQSILDGLRDRFRANRERWDMSFACGADAALAIIGQSSVDVVVSDMRMPGMDGADLLKRIRATYPQTARIMLTGQAEREAVLRALPEAHQVLAKPCDMRQLRDAIDRACGLEETLQRADIRRLVGGLSHLPSAPRMYGRLTSVAANPLAGIADFADVISTDPAMALKVLQLTNSAYFGIRQSVTSIHQAVALLGIELVKGLALMGELFGTDGDQSIAGRPLQRLQELGLLTARIAKKLLPDKPRSEEAFTAGLVHDIGRLVLAQGLGEVYAKVVRDAEASGEPLLIAERERLGATHSEVGAYLLGVWGLPFAIVEAVANHHEPSQVKAGDRQVLAAVHAADVLVDSLFDRPAQGDPHFDLAFLTDAGFSDRLDSWRKIAETEATPSDRKPE